VVEVVAVALVVVVAQEAYCKEYFPLLPVFLM
jgi:hypothetical protein